MPATVRELLTEGTRRLSRVVKDNPKLIAEYLLRSILSLKKIDLYLEPERPVSAAAAAEFWTKVGRKLEREPLQYIIGSTEWFGLMLRCDPRALVPRPETEILTEKAIELVPPGEKSRLLEIGTGNGAIAIALARELPAAEVVATDLSAEALTLAADNVGSYNLGTRIDLRQGSLFEPVAADPPFDLVISNPPYVRDGEYAGLPPEVRDHEPATALVAGDDGLDIIKPLIAGAPGHLKPGGWLILEFGVDHAISVKQLSAAAGKYADPVIVSDYNGQERGAILQVR
jgi:release factor glutamine methyltransferase